jgi:3D (Asp-Asp-Asp) domain-containing protein
METIASHSLLVHLDMTGFPPRGITGEGRMKGLIVAVGVALLFACQPFTRGRSTLARVTVYWRGEGSGEHASWSGVRLREAHCAVDPKKIPYGSKVAFPDATCVAVDSGPDVVNRKAARLCGQSAAERDAIVIDLFLIRNRRLSLGQKRIRIS